MSILACDTSDSSCLSVSVCLCVCVSQLVSGVTQTSWLCRTPSFRSSSWTRRWPTRFWSICVCWTSIRSRSQRETPASSAPSVNHCNTVTQYNNNHRYYIFPFIFFISGSDLRWYIFTPNQFMISLRIEPLTLELLTPALVCELQENLFTVFFVFYF